MSSGKLNLDDMSDAEYDKAKATAIKSMGGDLPTFVTRTLIMMLPPQELVGERGGHTILSNVSMLAQVFTRLGVINKADFTKLYLEKVDDMVNDSPISRGLDMDRVGKAMHELLTRRIDSFVFGETDQIVGTDIGVARAKDGLEAVNAVLTQFVSDWLTQRTTQLMRENLVALKQTLPQPNGPITIDKLIELM